MSVIDAHTVMNTEQPAMVQEYYGKQSPLDAGQLLATPTGATPTYIHWMTTVMVNHSKATPTCSNAHTDVQGRNPTYKHGL